MIRCRNSLHGKVYFTLSFVFFIFYYDLIFIHQCQYLSTSFGIGRLTSFFLVYITVERHAPQTILYICNPDLFLLLCFRTLKKQYTTFLLNFQLVNETPIRYHMVSFPHKSVSRFPAPSSSCSRFGMDSLCTCCPPTGSLFFRLSLNLAPVPGFFFTLYLYCSYADFSFIGFSTHMRSCLVKQY